jgi:Tripartite tricarboxylate transporter TctB family
VADSATETGPATRGRDKHPRRGLPPGFSGERIFAVGLFAVGVVAVVQGLGYGFIRDDGIIGPGFTPIVFGVILILCTMMVLVGSFRAPAEKTATLMDEIAQQSLLEGVDDVAPVDREGSERSALLVAVGIGVSLWLAGWIGLIPALTVLVLVILRWIEKETWVKSILIAVFVGVAAWLIFTYFLQVPLDFGVISLYWHV